MEFIKTTNNVSKNYLRDFKIGSIIKIDEDFIVEKSNSKKIYTAKDFNLQGKKAMICKDGMLTILGFPIDKIIIPKFKFSGYNFDSIAKYLDNHLNNRYCLHDMISDYNCTIFSDYNTEDSISNIENIKETILKTLNKVLVSEKEIISLTRLEVEALSKSICEDLDKKFNINYLFEHEAYWYNEDIKYEDAVDSISTLLLLFF